MIDRVPFIIAEVSGNHDGDPAKMLRLIEAAARSGCDAVKFQLYNVEDMPDDGGDYEKYRVRLEWLEAIFEFAKDKGIPIFASVFAPWAVEFLRPFNPWAYKIASPESTRLPFETYQAIAKAVHQTGKPLIVSTGIEDMAVMRSFSPDILMYCKRGYPSFVVMDDLKIMRNLENDPGFSDHTVGIKAALMMIAVGAKVIEKHIKLDEDCIDAAFSLNPRQMKELCELVHR